MAVVATRIADFDIWREGYANATVEVLEPRTLRRKAIYYDQDKTEPAPNPITLLRYTTDNGRTFGKFERPLYTVGAYTLRIDSTDQTGVVREGLSSLQDQDASFATSRTKTGTRDRRLIDRFNDVVHALDYGILGGSSATNTQTLEDAIGAVAGRGGGDIIVPAGTYRFTSLSLPDNCRLRGQHPGATTLQSEQGDKVVTLDGNGSGLIDLTLDGVSLQSGSIGVYGVAPDRTVFQNATVKRFDTGLYLRGGALAQWDDFFIENCETGAFLSGDSDAGDTGSGSSFEFNEWNGGGITNCTTFGMRVHFEDQITRFNTFRDLDLRQNPNGTTVEINGARETVFEGCAWSGNVQNLVVQDDSDTTFGDINTVIGLRIKDSYFNGGDIEFNDTCRDVVIERASIADVDFTLNSPENPIVVIDSTEDANVTLSGETDRYLRQSTISRGTVTGVTTDDTALTAYTLPLDSGQVGYIEAKVIANQQDGENYGLWHISVGVRRPGAELDYDNQTDDFVVGETVTGNTSGATARIIADNDSGATGTLTLRDIDGTFENNETITGTSQGSAKVNGTITLKDVVKDSGGDNAIRAAVDTTGTSLDASFAVSGGEAQVQVTGTASDVYEWQVTVDVEVF